MIEILSYYTNPETTDDKNLKLKRNKKVGGI